MTEDEWKILRRVKPLALDRLCTRILAECQAAIADAGVSSHERYLNLFQLVRDRDDDIAWAFNDLKRSIALQKLAAMCKLGLVTADELGEFSERTQETIKLITGMMKDPEAGPADAPAPAAAEAQPAVAEEKWYVVYLLFAQEPEAGGEGKPVVCESSQVLVRAPSARAAYERGEQLGREHEQGRTVRLVGVEYMSELTGAPADGVEVGGMYTEMDDPWGRRDELIPPPGELWPIKLENNPDKPLNQLMAPEKIEQGRRVLGS